MIDKRKANYNWIVSRPDGGSSQEQARLAVLMDIRGELRTLNLVFECSNFLAIQHTLSEIARNTAKPRKKRKA